MFSFVRRLYGTPQPATQPQGSPMADPVADRVVISADEGDEGFTEVSVRNMTYAEAAKIALPAQKLPRANTINKVTKVRVTANVSGDLSAMVTNSLETVNDDVIAEELYGAYVDDIAARSRSKGGRKSRLSRRSLRMPKDREEKEPAPPLAPYWLTG